MSEVAYKRTKFIMTSLFFCLAFIAAATVSIENAPDEAMRYPIAMFIYQNGVLPNGMEDSLINQIWGFSYALYPYLTSIISAGFMKLVSIFASSPASLLTAARLTGVFAGTGTLIFCYKIGEELFENKSTVIFFSSLVCFLPQFVFLCSYQNNDSFAVFTSSIIIFFWIRALKTDWALKSLIGLGIGCGLCALSYYNAYIYILCSLLLYFVSLLIKKEPAEKIVKGAVIVFVIAFAIGGWFFIRNATLHDGDILGMNTATLSAENFALDGYKPSQKITPKSEGLSLIETYFKSNMFQGSSNWFKTVIRSFIGCFGYMSVMLPKFMHGLYFIIFAIGIISLLTRNIGHLRIRTNLDFMIVISFVVAIVINIFLFMYTVYKNDYQAQGRYMMPSLIPLMILIAEGYKVLTHRIAIQFMDPGSTKEDRLGSLHRRSSIMCILLTVIYLVLFAISYLVFMIPGCH